MSCCDNALTESQLLQALLDQSRSSFDRLQQVIQSVSAGGSGNYGYFYNLAVSATVAPAAPFPFDSSSALTPGFTHTNSAVVATSAPITIQNAGTYGVHYSVTVAEARQIALYVNGAVNLATIYGAATGTVVTSAFAVITVAANALLTLRNHTSVAALTLVTPSGGTANNATNSLFIRQLA